jgi:4-amino-4-deoxy-L-arabinose transferase-like glycosyltransferase
MSSETLAASSFAPLRRLWPEALLAVLACAVFLGSLGSIELWGKREQRASAEAIDTVDHNHWLVAEIQGRPRLEKPPLPRWSIATLIILTGRRDEWIIRLPGAVAGMATVGLIYLLGRRMAGRALGLASAFVLCSTGFFVGEMRQASNDCLLTFFVTLALYAVFCRLHDNEPTDFPGRPHRRLAPRVWNLIFHTALGLGFLTKGPVVLLLVAVTLVPYLAFGRRLTSGLRMLYDPWGLVMLIFLAFGWPAAVLASDPYALQVWSLEMTEKTGLSRILEHRWHSPLIGQWPGLVLPWTLIGAVAVALPGVWSLAGPRQGRGPTTETTTPAAPWGDEKTVWFAWWWAMGNLLLFCTWAVAKPNYYIPCVPGMALLIGAAWLFLTRTARGHGNTAVIARGILQAQWVSMFVAAAVAPVVIRAWLPPALWPWSLAIAISVASSVAVSAYLWRKGADAPALVPVAAACVFGVLVAYGIIAPAENEVRSHRLLAQQLDRIVPARVRTLNFFNEIDEGLWFYLSGINLAPVPGTHPRYNTAFDLAHSYLTDRSPSETILHLEARRQARDKQALFEWFDQSAPETSYLLIRASVYDSFAADLAGRALPLLRESGLKRNELVLLQATGRRPTSITASASLQNRR